MKEALKPKDQEQPAVEKKVYIPPTLTKYGKLTELTAGGSGKKSEGSDVVNKTKYP
jgi:hypothetical protein